VSATGGTDRRTQHGAERCALGHALGCGFIGIAAANLYARVIAAYEIVGTELVEILPRAGQCHDAGAVRYCHAGSQDDGQQEQHGNSQ
jgi:hypothetical protein